MEQIFLAVLYFALFVHIVLVVVTALRVWRADSVIDRLLATDLISTLIVAVLVLVSLIYQESIYIDVALGLAALGFVGSVVLAKYLADEQMY